MNNHTQELAKKIVDIINKKKVVKLELLNVQALTSLTDLFIIAVASNTRLTKAIADEIEEKLTLEDQLNPLRKEGYQTAKWILLDYGEIIIHILDEEDARFYTLERLWKDAEIIISM